MEKKSKVETFIGFAFRAGKARCGAHAISTQKGVKLLILCHTAAKNSIEEVVKLAKRFRVKIIVSNKKTVEDLSNKEHCKIIAIMDTALTKAIMDNLDNDFSEYIWEA